jgi:RNA polymerase sigma-70 factor (ECF subfamily)
MGEPGAGGRSPDALYEEASTTHGPALARLARAYEPDADRHRDLLQEIHLALWRSFARFDGRCSLRTWVYRVAHNTATSAVIRRRASAPALVALDAVAEPVAAANGEREFDAQRALDRLLAFVRALKPLDRQVMVLYLEGESAATIADVTGLTPGNVATKIHRIKQLVVERFRKGAADGA